MDNAIHRPSELTNSRKPNDARVRSKIECAFSRFMEKDRKLLEISANERSMTHRLAVHIARMFPRYDVDCEYNRDDHEVKRLHSFCEKVSTDDTKGVTIYPDIIVHKRGTSTNLVVIEAKTSSSDNSCSNEGSCHWDKCKLQAFKVDLRYQYAFYIVFPVGQKLSAYSPANIHEFILSIE